MSLKQQINDTLKEKMRAKASVEVAALRQIKTEIMKVETQGSASEASDEDVMKVLKVLAKQHQESIEIFKKENREELLAKEVQELELIQSFLPENLSEEQLKNLAAEAIQESGAEGPKDMGKVMKVLKSKIEATGKGADNRLLAEIVKSSLAGS